jgi:hypothetical protein
MYAKVFGTVRVYKEEKAIVGTHIRKIEKFEEVTNHFLQTFVAHQIRTKGVLTVRIYSLAFYRTKISNKLRLLSKCKLQLSVPLLHQ